MVKAAAFNQGKFPTIAFVNLATVPLGTDLRKLVAALDKQMQQDFVPIWGYPATLYVAQKPKPGEWQVVFLDDADAANALGYHDITKDGQPVSKVFVKTTVAAGQIVSVTASHELLEMMIDPGAQLWAQNTNGWFYAYEMCDAVEGVAVSDFVYPSFFESWHEPRSVQFDHLGKVAQPFQTLQNGYQIVSDGKSTREIFGSAPKERDFRELEIRTMHRSEYRKQIMLGARAAVRSRSAAIGNTAIPSDAHMRAPHAAVLHHAGRFLTALAEVVDPLPAVPFELAARRSPAAVVDPLPGDPFEL